MQKTEVRDNVVDILQKLEYKPGNKLLHYINTGRKGERIDHNQIRKAVINCFKSHDKRAVVLGSLLLQLDNDEINELVKDKTLN